MPKKLAVLFAALAAAGAVFAQDKPPEPDYTLSFNIGAVTDYRYRGISQSRLDPALQGGVDFAHKSGFYIGTWASTIRWVKDAGGKSNEEIDLYGGYKFNAGPVGVDVGLLRYFYPDNALPVNADTTEAYIAGTWGPATLKYSHATTNLFGFANSKNSGYLDLSATFDLPWWGLTLTPHVGHQRVANNGFASYTDYALTLGKDFGRGVSASLGYVKADTSAYVAPNGKNLARGELLAGVKYTF